MDRLSALERAIARRYRALQGLRSAGIAFVSAASIALAASVAARCSAIRPGLAICVGVMLVAGLAAVAGFVVGHARRFNLPRLLLFVDLALGTGERLSSLHELRLRDASPFLQRRIEERLTQSPPAWGRAVRAGRAEILPWVTGSAALGAALVLALSATVATAPGPASPSTGVASREAPQTRKTSEASPPARPGEPAGSAADVLTPEQGEMAEPLVDVLAELLPTRPSRGLVGPTEDAMKDERRTGGGSSEGLSSLLTEIARRSQERAPQDFGLTEQERSDLRDLAEGLPDSALREALLAILAGETGDAVKEQIAKAQGLLSGGDSTEEEMSLGAVPGEPNGDGRQGASEAEDELPQGTASGNGDRDAAGDEAEAGANPEAAGAEGASSASSGGHGAGPRRSGSDEAASLQAPGLVPEQLLSEWGASGDVRRFMTKGLPFEPPSDEPNGSPVALALDVETLQSLFETRALAPQLQDLVRTYFETITQGEP